MIDRELWEELLDADRTHRGWRKKKLRDSGIGMPAKTPPSSGLWDYSQQKKNTIKFIPNK